MLQRIIKDNKLCVKCIFCPLSCGFTLSLSEIGRTPFDVSCMRVLKSEEVSKLTIIRRIVDDKIRALASFERAKLVASAETVGRIDGRRS